MVIYWTAIGSQRFKLNSLVNFSGKFIYIDDNASTKYNKICEKSVMNLLKNVVIVVTLVIFAHLLALVGPIHAYIFNDIRVTPTATHLPFLEKDSNTGFMLNLAQQSVIAFYSMSANITVEIMTCLIANTISTIPKLIRLNLKELADEAQKKYSRLSIHIRLRNVLIQVQDYDRCIADCFTLKFRIA